MKRTIHILCVKLDTIVVFSNQVSYLAVSYQVFPSKCLCVQLPFFLFFFSQQPHISTVGNPFNADSSKIFTNTIVRERSFLHDTFRLTDLQDSKSTYA